MRLLAACLLLLAGCASVDPYPMGWTRAGSTSDDLRMEAAQCRVQAKTGSSGERSGYNALMLATALYRDCMIGRGWTPVPRAE